MSRFGAAIAATILVCAPGAQAAEVTGGELSLGYSAFTEDSDLNALSLEGSIEIGFTPAFALQIDAMNRRFDFIGDDASNLTLHGIYHLNTATSFGVFYGYDSFPGGDIDFYGLEAAHDVGAFDVQGYVFHGEESGVSGTVFGVGGTYAVLPELDLGLSLDRGDFDGDVDLTRVAARGEYGFDNGVSVFAELGGLNGGIDGESDTETFVGVGASYSFGADRGATFDRRGLARLIPGL